MSGPIPEVALTAEAICAEIKSRLAGRTAPALIAMDGRSGAGKSTLAVLIARELRAAHIPSDDFYAAHISDAEWDARSPEARAAEAIDWRRLRAEALEPLLAGKPARWRAFDFAAVRRDGTYPLRTDFVEVQPATLIVLDGAYSTRPELLDLIDLSVLVEAPDAVRRERLVGREAPEFLAAWHARWDAAEDFYFTRVRPRMSFDFVVNP